VSDGGARSKGARWECSRGRRCEVEQRAKKKKRGRILAGKLPFRNNAQPITAFPRVYRKLGGKVIRHIPKIKTWFFRFFLFSFSSMISCFSSPYNEKRKGKRKGIERWERGDFLVVLHLLISTWRGVLWVLCGVWLQKVAPVFVCVLFSLGLWLLHLGLKVLLPLQLLPHGLHLGGIKSRYLCVEGR